jgi:L-alanine-DL-glutamate epimerase-like enolase superfamily enzyme
MPQKATFPSGSELSAAAPAIDRLDVVAYRIPTDAPESDGTFTWDSTTLVLVEIGAADRRGIGYTYGSPAVATVIREHLEDVVRGRDPLAVGEIWERMVRAVRNIGRPGIASHAIAAVDVALWDLKGRLLGLPLARLIGQVRDSVPVYGSGGFTSYSERELREQLAGWVEAGMRRVKMKIGREPARDPARVEAARHAIGPGVELFVDANGACDRKRALALARRLSEHDVTWFEEPVSSDDLDGLRLLRDRAPEGMEITAGEYGYDLPYFRRMLAAGAVDVLQADATRCAGITGFLQVGALCQAYGVPLSAHTAPALHLAACCALSNVRHIEYFHDHARIERRFFDGFPSLDDGQLVPDLSVPGLGLIPRRSELDPYSLPHA